MSKELDDNTKELLNKFGCETIEDAIAKWNELKTAVYHAFSFITLSVHDAKYIVGVLKAIQNGQGLEIIDRDKLHSYILMLDSKVKPFRPEPKQNE